CFSSSILLGSLLLVMISGFESATFSNETDGQALLDFKNRITEDPLQIISSWNDSLHFCKWWESHDSELGVTRLVGSIPPSIGNLTFLTGINLRNNSFNGAIPQEMGRLIHLQHLNFTYNSFVGRIPTNITHCTELTVLDLVYNELVGQIPDQLSSLSKLLSLVLASTILQAFHYQMLPAFKCSISLKSLTGTVPTNLGRLQVIYRINFDDNILGKGDIGDLLTFLRNCTRLEVLGLAINQFGGELPNSIANLSTSLKILTLGNNLLHGNIPYEIGNLFNLTVLGLERNFLTDKVPDAVGKLQQLGRLDLNGNNLSGPIPSSLGNLTSLTMLFMEENGLEGTIPPSLGKCLNLEQLNISSNKLSGTIPKEVIAISSLSISLPMSHNFLTGSLPMEVGKLRNLMELDVSDNRLSGEIPSTLSTCLSLERLLVKNNLLQGTIPESLKTLRGLQVIDFSHNNFSGQIPEFWESFLLSRNSIFHSIISMAKCQGKASLQMLVQFPSWKMMNYVEVSRNYICLHALKITPTHQQNSFPCK
ncbi:unnamed protein product, partial [Ilex paraguariensis]